MRAISLIQDEWVPNNEGPLVSQNNLVPKRRGENIIDITSKQTRACHFSRNRPRGKREDILKISRLITNRWCLNILQYGIIWRKLWSQRMERRTRRGNYEEKDYAVLDFLDTKLSCFFLAKLLSKISEFLGGWLTIFKSCLLEVGKQRFSASIWPPEFFKNCFRLRILSLFECDGVRRQKNIPCLLRLSLFVFLPHKGLLWLRESYFRLC